MANRRTILRLCEGTAQPRGLPAKETSRAIARVVFLGVFDGNTSSKHWKRWLGVEHRCIVPFTSFSEFNKAAGGDIWFALDETPPLAVFAGIWANWISVRKVREGETANDLFGFLTTEPNDVVGAIHPKAMPVILTEPDEIEAWLTAPADEALKLQRPLPDGVLKIVAKGTKQDAPKSV